jgi:cytochrome c oxidase subunit II
MRGKIIAFAAIGLAGGIMLCGPQGTRAQTRDASSSGSTKMIEVSAKKYEFDPAEIHVKKGTRVELKVHSVDETHGIKLSLTPEGGDEKASPGLLFDKPEDNGKVEKHQDQVLDFVAQQAGTYDFTCAKLCGIHHGKMKGKLIVED